MLHALAPAVRDEPGTARVHFTDLHFETRECLQFIDLTEDLAAAVARSGIVAGLLTVQTLHTTAAIVVNEHEPLLLQDLRDTLERLAPCTRAWRHDDFTVRTVNMTPDERPNGHAHAKALFLRASETLRVRDGRLQLGRWQRVFLVELDSARPRNVAVTILGA
jgi:secondary thiamine-phosphate synthase enzyme